MKALAFRIMYPLALVAFCTVHISIRLVWGSEEAERVTDHLLTTYENLFL